MSSSQVTKSIQGARGFSYSYVVEEAYESIKEYLNSNSNIRRSNWTTRCTSTFILIDIYPGTLNSIREYLNQHPRIENDKLTYDYDDGFYSRKWNIPIHIGDFSDYYGDTTL